MSIKRKLLLTNILIFAVMVLLALGYNLFANALKNKFSIMDTTREALEQASVVLTDSSLTEKEKADNLDQLGYSFSIYDLNGNLLKKFGGYELKGYTFTSTSMTPKIVIFSSKVVLESRSGSKFYAAVKISSREAKFNYLNSLAITIMIFNTFSGTTKYSLRKANIFLYYLGQLLIAYSLFL